MLFQEDEENGKDKADKSSNMIPLKRLPLEQKHNNNRKNRQRNHLLNHLQLHKIERTPVANETNPVRRHSETILKESNTPREQNNQNKRPSAGNLHLTQLQMAVPRKSHKYV